MSSHHEHENLLNMAKKDIAALEGMVDDKKHFADEIFGFHAQQAVEKILKYHIALLGQQYPFTHDLSLLMNILQENGTKIDAWLDLLELNIFSVQFRYEAMDTIDEPLDRLAILSQIKLLKSSFSDAL